MIWFLFVFRCARERNKEEEEERKTTKKNTSTEACCVSYVLQCNFLALNTTHKSVCVCCECFGSHLRVEDVLVDWPTGCRYHCHGVSIYWRFHLIIFCLYAGQRSTICAICSLSFAFVPHAHYELIRSFYALGAESDGYTICFLSFLLLNRQTNTIVI